MNVKEFSHSLHAENDPCTRGAVRKLFSSLGWMVTENSYPYGHDLTISEYLEVERRPSWEEGPFPFTTVNIPYRKAKYFGVKGKYVVVNKTGTRFLVTDFETVKDSAVEDSPNKYVLSGEKFFKVPVSKFSDYGY